MSAQATEKTVEKIRAYYNETAEKAEAPKPAPTLPDMKYRKGKAGSICTEM